MEVKTFGRGSQNDVDVNDTRVSRSHCQIIKDNGRYFIRDLGSTNGTYVNGSRINGERSLSLYDTVTIGDTTLPWQKYFGVSEDNRTRVSPIGNNYGQNVNNYSSNQYNVKSNSNSAILTFFLGIISACCIAYIVISFMTSGEKNVMSAFGGTNKDVFKLFCIYLKGVDLIIYSYGGQWLLMITALVSGAAAKFIHNRTEEDEENKLSNFGSRLGGFFAGIAVVFIILAIFAENIVQM